MNEQLGIQQRMASTTRAIRDGWISAIGAMNTGAGTFSKIVMDQTKNTAEAARALGAIISSKTGAFGAGAGYARSERFTLGGEISGYYRGKGGPYRQWGPFGGRRHPRELEMGMRGGFMQRGAMAGEFYTTMARMAMGQGAPTLGLNRYTTGAALASGGTTINVNFGRGSHVSFDSIRDLEEIKNTQDEVARQMMY